jgi:hypothetical protein
MEVKIEDAYVMLLINTAREAEKRIFQKMHYIDSDILDLKLCNKNVNKSRKLVNNLPIED